MLLLSSHDSVPLSSPPVEAGMFSTVTDVTMSPPAPTSPIALMNDVGSGREFKTMQSSATPPARPVHNLTGGNEHGTPPTPAQGRCSGVSAASQDSVLLGIMRRLASDRERSFDDDLAGAVPVQETSSSSGDQGALSIHLTRSLRPLTDESRRRSCVR